jgi:predicted MFS family arabinose efflux permease
VKAKKPKGFKNFLDGMKELNNDPVCNNVFWAGSIRSFGSAIVTAFIPVYFQQAFPECKSQFALVSALSLTVLGFGSSLMGGILSDKFEKKSYMSKANIVIAGNVLALPMIAMACLSGNFWVAMTGFALKVMVSGSYLAPAITMMQNSSGTANAGMVVSAYTFYSHIAQTIAPALFGALAKHYGAF